MGIRVLIAGGGTSGHINPAIAIADRLRADIPDSCIEFCGTKNGIESDTVPRAGYALHMIRASGMPARLSKKMVRALLNFKAGRKTCISLIRTFKPDVIVGTGGYVCSPLVSAAYHQHIPVLLHEQNAFPGRSNRLLSRNADVVCTSFPEMNAYFPKAKSVVFTGNPVRAVFFTTERETARKELHLADDTFLILAMGGSLGANTINTAVTALSAMNFAIPVKIILSAGKQQFAAFKEQTTKTNDRIEVMEYLYNPQTYMAAADIVICRSGAITCAEVAALKLPSVMIPYPFAAGDHQTYNARVFEQNGACILIADKEASAEHLYQAILPLMQDRPKLLRMGEKAGELARQQADKDIVQQIMLLTGQKST